MVRRKGEAKGGGVVRRKGEAKGVWLGGRGREGGRGHG